MNSPVNQESLSSPNNIIINWVGAASNNAIEGFKVTLQLQRNTMQSINTSLADKLNALPRPSHSEITRLAAQLWEKRGRPANRDEEIWLEAEQLLLIDWSHSQARTARSAQPKSAGQTRFPSKPSPKSVGIP